MERIVNAGNAPAVDTAQPSSLSGLPGQATKTVKEVIAQRVNAANLLSFLSSDKRIAQRLNELGLRPSSYVHLTTSGVDNIKRRLKMR
ncbi:hypothetical protein [Sodalis praecaptivus]|uniref:hypothetical protein n=1 Tax=Sodalis TaxID=84565 RepID=UPI0004AE434D|nr:hypothetical protein [Sodalis praecaptivus]